ncbi:MAG: signal peptidase II [Bdellovibrionia bacterium]
MKEIVRLKIHRFSLILMIVFSTIGCDQATKIVARDTLRAIGSLSYLNNTIRLQYTENPGAFLSLGAELPPHYRFAIFTILAGIFLSILGYRAFYGRAGIPAILGLALMLGGGVGNLIDRFARGQVIDFMNIGVGGIRTGIFNIADVAVVAGLLLIALDAYLVKAPQPKRIKRP